MKITKFNEKAEDLLFIKGVFKEFKTDVQEIFDNIFIEFKDNYFESVVDGDYSHTVYTLKKEIEIENGFDSVAKAFKIAYEAMEDFKVDYQHVIDTFNTGSLFDDYPEPHTINYSLMRSMPSTKSLTIGIRIHIHYKED